MAAASRVSAYILTECISSPWPAKCRYAAVAETPTWRAASRSTTASGPPVRASSVAALVSALARSPWWYAPRSALLGVTPHILPDILRNTMLTPLSYSAIVNAVNIRAGRLPGDRGGAHCVREIRLFRGETRQTATDHLRPGVRRRRRRRHGGLRQTAQRRLRRPGRRVDPRPTPHRTEL